MYATLLVAMLLILAACGNGNGNGGGSGTTSIATRIPRLAAKQILTFPNVGIDDSNPPDPALVSDQDTGLVVNMIYSGLVTSDIKYCLL
ncbi:MAG: hypothetical protein E6I80_04290 [Chloroflexi bacterium]|nr:MAG: hypothetical protein E6I80_04290 [Chloroflexota bacterium]